MKTVTRKREIRFEVEETFVLCDRCETEFRSDGGSAPPGVMPPGYGLATAGKASPEAAGWWTLERGNFRDIREVTAAKSAALLCPPCGEAVLASFPVKA